MLARLQPVDPHQLGGVCYGGSRQGRAAGESGRANTAARPDQPLNGPGYKPGG